MIYGDLVDYIAYGYDGGKHNRLQCRSKITLRIK